MDFFTTRMFVRTAVLFTGIRIQALVALATTTFPQNTGGIAESRMLYIAGAGTQSSSTFPSLPEYSGTVDLVGAYAEAQGHEAQNLAEEYPSAVSAQPSPSAEQSLNDFFPTNGEPGPQTGSQNLDACLTKSTLSTFSTGDTVPSSPETSSGLIGFTPSTARPYSTSSLSISETAPEKPHPHYYVVSMAEDLLSLPPQQLASGIPIELKFKHISARDSKTAVASTMQEWHVSRHINGSNSAFLQGWATGTGRPAQPTSLNFANHSPEVLLQGRLLRSVLKHLIVHFII